MADNFRGKVLEFLGFGPDEDYEDDDIEEIVQEKPEKPEKPDKHNKKFKSTDRFVEERPIDRIPERQSPGISRKGNVLSIHSTASVAPMKVVLSEPSDFDDVKDICDELKNMKPVIVNFENVDTALAQRMVDFISGSIYSLDGSIQKVSRGIIIIAPQNVDILGSIKSSIGNDIYEMEGIFGWLK